MNTRDIIIGASLGFAAGLILSSQLPDKSISPEKALKLVKNALREKLDIEGSWIQMTPEKLEQDKLSYTVYQGGITASEDGVVKHYDFAVESKTGTIVDLTAY